MSKTQLLEDVESRLAKLTANEQKLVNIVCLLAQGFIELRQFSSDKLGGTVVILAQNKATGEACDPLKLAHDTILEVVGGEEGWKDWPESQSSAVN